MTWQDIGDEMLREEGLDSGGRDRVQRVRTACAAGCAPARRQGVHRLRRHSRGAAAPKGRGAATAHEEVPIRRF